MYDIELTKIIKDSNSSIIEWIDELWYSDSVISNEMVFNTLNVHELLTH